MNKQVIELGNGTFKVLGSDSITYYTVNRAGHCNCKGHGYRKKCRHVDSLKKKGLLDKDRIVKQEKNCGFGGTNLVPRYIRDKKGLRIELIPV